MTLQDILKEQLNRDSLNNTDLNNLLRLLAKHRSGLIQSTILQHQGTRVMEGPLAGLDFLPHSAEGCHVPKILGTYEQPLHQTINEIIATGYQTILNIGCAEGYYAVGLARKMPQTQFFAFDINENAQKVCAELALKNNVRQRINIAGVFDIADFAKYDNQNVLVFCDIEGAEQELLNPDRAPALRNFDIILEAHECFIPGLMKSLYNRFSSSHDISVILDNGMRQLNKTPNWFYTLANLDQLLAVWEWRTGPTPWMVLKSKSLQAKKNKG
jgi:hypothetical protein